MLARDDFLFVVDKTPLIAIDLFIVRNACEVLLGKRLNRPAQGYWFVPGGRIRKGENIANALLRVAETELGLGNALTAQELTVNQLGVYEHFYDDCFAGECGVATHYVVLCHRIDVPKDFEPPAIDTQHADWRWWSLDEALLADSVHRYTKDYLTLQG